MWINLQLCVASLWCVSRGAGAPRMQRSLLYNPYRVSSQLEWASYYDDGRTTGEYSFGYDIEDAPTRNVQYRQEQRYPNGTVTGSYGLLEPDGNVRIVHYIADAYGFRARVENSLKKDQQYPSLSLLKALSWYHVVLPRMDSTVRINQTKVEASQSSPQLQAAIQSLPNLGKSPVFEQRVRPSVTTDSPLAPASLVDDEYELNYIGSYDQSHSYPSIVPNPNLAESSLL